MDSIVLFHAFCFADPFLSGTGAGCMISELQPSKLKQVGRAGKSAT
jgi:hypothetical protein